MARPPVGRASAYRRNAGTENLRIAKGRVRRVQAWLTETIARNIPTMDVIAWGCAATWFIGTST